MTPGRRAPNEAGRAPAGALPRHFHESGSPTSPRKPILGRHRRSSYRIGAARLRVVVSAGSEPEAAPGASGAKPRPAGSAASRSASVCHRWRPRASGIGVGLAWLKTGVNQKKQETPKFYTKRLVLIRTFPQDRLAGRERAERFYRSHLDLLVRSHALDGGTLKHPVLERRVVLHLPHGELAADAPGVEHEAVRIEHRVLLGKPVESGQHAG